MTTITNRMYFLSMSAVVPCHHFEIHYTHHCHHSSSLSLLSVSRQHHSGNTNSLFRFHHIESQGRSKWVLSQFTTTHTYTHNYYYCYAAISSYVICMRRSLHQITTQVCSSIDHRFQCHQNQFRSFHVLHHHHIPQHDHDTNCYGGYKHKNFHPLLYRISKFCFSFVFNGQ